MIAWIEKCDFRAEAVVFYRLLLNASQRLASAVATKRGQGRARGGGVFRYLVLVSPFLLISCSVSTSIDEASSVVSGEQEVVEKGESLEEDKVLLIRFRGEVAAESEEGELQTILERIGRYDPNLHLIGFRREGVLNVYVLVLDTVLPPSQLVGIIEDVDSVKFAREPTVYKIQ